MGILAQVSNLSSSFFFSVRGAPCENVLLPSIEPAADQGLRAEPCCGALVSTDAAALRAGAVVERHVLPRLVQVREGTLRAILLRACSGRASSLWFDVR